MAEFGPEEREPIGKQQPWSKRSGNPYRDDPPPLSPKDPSAVPVQQEELELEEKTEPVCICGRCLKGKETEVGQKCCHDIPGWQRKYNSGCSKEPCLTSDHCPPLGHICLLDLPNFKNIFNEDSHR